MNEALYAVPQRYSFFQAVRLLHLERGGAQVLGEAIDPSEEAVRFRAHPSLEFPASEIQDLVASAAGPPAMTVNFFGAFGPLGVLPHPWTELIVDRVRYRDEALRDFLDLFDHRLLSLFYRSWEKVRFPVSYERTGEDRFTGYLFSLVGMGTPGLRNRLSFPDQALLHYAGLFRQQPPSAAALRLVLSHYFRAPVEVIPFHGQWADLEPEDRTRLGAGHCALGQDAVAGDGVFVAQAKFRLRIGPLSLEKFTAFLPVGDAHRPLADMTRHFIGFELDFDAQLVLRAEEVPFCHLRSDSLLPPMLGWTTWIRTRDLEEDAEDVVLVFDESSFGKREPVEGKR